MLQELVTLHYCFNMMDLVKNLKNAMFAVLI